MSAPPSSNPAGAEAAMEELFEEWQIKDQDNAKYFAAAAAGAIALFTITHWTHKLYSKHCNKQGAIGTMARTISRPIRRLHMPRSLGRFTIMPGKLHIAFAYFAINGILTFHDNPQSASMGTILSKRFGWMALLNMTLAIFLGLKNTPLSPLAGRSFDSVNLLHRCVGYTTIFFVLLHSISYVAGLASAGHGVLQELMTESHQIAASIAGICMVLILVTSVGFVRKRTYEFFYAMHIVLVATILITVGIHRPSIALKAAIITTVAGTMWLADKSLRLSRWLYHGTNNYCTLTPLPDSATRITLRHPMRADPGSSAFIWIPSIRLFQRHPFTMVQSEPNVEFIVKARDGFTRELHLAACKNPGLRLRAAIEGPYGHVPNVNEYDKLVLVAGGSGVTFTMALALAWIRKRRTPKDFTTLDFVWTVRDGKTLEWFSGELAELRANKRVNLSLYITGPSNPNTPTRDQSPPPSPDIVEEEKITGTTRKEILIATSPRSSDSTINSAYLGRPDVRTIITHAVEKQSINDRILIAGCGPGTLLASVRRAVAEKTIIKAPSIKMFLEEFTF